MIDIKSYGIAFAGGGAKGAYGVGAWRAIIEEDIYVSTVVGTSIGAIHAALYTQGELEKTIELWDDIRMERILKPPSDIVVKDKLFDFRNLVPIVRDIWHNSGLDTTPLHELLENYIDEDKVRSSKIRFGLATFSKSDLKPIDIFIEDIPKGELINYLVASSSFPGFKNTVIGNKQYIDGGVTNNMPINMLVEAGIKDIIAIDLGGVGMKRIYDETGLNIVKVRNNHNVGTVFDFTKHNMEKNILFGYLDALKAFDQLRGKIYYFTNHSYHMLRQEFSSETVNGLEMAAKIYGISETEIYFANEFLKLIYEKHQAAKKMYRIEKKHLNKATLIDDIKKMKLNINPDFILPLIENMICEKWLGNNTFGMLRNFFGTECNAVNALLVLERYYN